MGVKRIVGFFFFFFKKVEKDVNKHKEITGKEFVRTENEKRYCTEENTKGET